MPADLDLVRRLAAADHGWAVVATTRTDGSVHASVVNAGVLMDPTTTLPVVGFVAGGSTVKLRLLRRTGLLRHRTSHEAPCAVTRNATAVRSR